MGIMRGTMSGWTFMLTICNTHYVLHHPAPPPLRLFCGTPTSCNGYEVAHPPSAESGRHEHTQRHDWPVAETKICSAQDHPARLLRLADSLKFDCEAGYRDLTGFEVESRGTDNNPLLLSPRSVSTPPQKQSNKIVEFLPDQAGGRKNEEHLQEAETVSVSGW